MPPEKNEVSETAIERWSLKDGLVVVPFLSSALALTWEVGYFQRVGGSSFGLFSLAEHITFAIQALPFALGLTTFALLLWFLKPKTGPSLSLKQRSVTLFVIGGLTGTFMVAHFAVGTGRLDVGEIILSIITVILFCLLIALAYQKMESPIAISVGFSVAFLLAYGFGLQSARGQILSTRPLNIIKVGEKGKEAETEIKVRIMRTGERGVLYFDPAAQSFGLLPWEVVKRIDWANSSVFKK